MMRISATTRLVLGLAVLVLSAQLVARSIGLGPHEDQMLMKGRSRLCETLAISSSLFVTRDDMSSLEIGLKAAVKHNPDVISAGLRKENGNLVIAVGDHHSHWSQDNGKPTADSDMTVQVLDGDQTWGSLEISFRPKAEGLLSFWDDSMTRFIVFTALSACFPFFFFLGSTSKT